MNLITTGEIDPFITQTELAEVARVDANDALLKSVIAMACAQVVSFLKLDVLPRTHTLIYEQWPTNGTVTRGICNDTYSYKDRVCLPYAGNDNVTEVLVNNELFTDYRVLIGKPTQLIFKNYYVTSSSEYNAIEITYTTGLFTQAHKVTETYKQAALLCAAYMFDHIGECSGIEAMRMSGASALLTPYAVSGGIAI